MVLRPGPLANLPASKDKSPAGQARPKSAQRGESVFFFATKPPFRLTLYQGVFANTSFESAGSAFRAKSINDETGMSILRAQY